MKKIKEEKIKDEENYLESSHQELLRNYFQDKSKEEILELFLNHLQKEHKLDIGDVNRLVEENEILLPISIFDNNKLSALEAITKYLKENKNLRFNQIAKALNRDDRAIWVTYNNARKKLKSTLQLKPSKYFIPITILTNRKFSVLESIAKYLKEQLKLTYHQIAILLNRNDRTIWTVYARAKKK